MKKSIWKMIKFLALLLVACLIMFLLFKFSLDFSLTFFAYGISLLIVPFFTKDPKLSFKIKGCVVVIAIAIGLITILSLDGVGRTLFRYLAVNLVVVAASIAYGLAAQRKEEG